MPQWKDFIYFIYKMLVHNGAWFSFLFFFCSNILYILPRYGPILHAHAFLFVSA